MRFSGLNTRKSLPESLTLHYLPRINDNVLEVDGSKIRPESPAFVTLHRVVNAKTVNEGDVIFGSRERVRANEAVRFEVYLRDEKVLKGVFRKGEGSEWKLECKCATESECESEVKVKEAEVCVAVEGHVAAATMNEKVEMVVKKRRKCLRECGRLEEIPEEIEEEEKEETESDGCCCCGEDGGDSEEDCTVSEIEGARWAVDMGIWVMCFGLGFLVSKASVKSLRRRVLF